MKKSGKLAFDALSNEQKRAAKWGLVTVVGCMLGAAVSMIALFFYLVWSGPRPNLTIAAVWIAATIIATTIGFRIISGRLHGVMGDSHSVPSDTPSPPDSN